MSYKQKLINPEIRFDFRFKEDIDVYEHPFHPLSPKQFDYNA